MTPPIPAAARRAASNLTERYQVGNWYDSGIGEYFEGASDAEVAEAIARECHLAETVAVLRRIIREDGVPLADGNWAVRLTPAEVRSARDLLATLDS